MIFVERDVHAYRVLQKNIVLLGLIDRCTLLNLSAEEGMDVLKKGQRHCDVIFLDPPYNMQLADRTLLLLAERDVLGEDGIVVVEHHVRELLSDCYGTLMMSDQRVYGKTGLSFFVPRKPDLS